MGQMAVVMSNRPHGALPRNTEVNPREQVHSITTRSGVQLPEIHIKRPVAYKKKEADIGEHMAETEEVILEPQVGDVKWKMRDKPQNMEKKIKRFLWSDTFDNLDIPPSST
ncbi:Uncharacterized protein Adt_43024 [Abeliophyllum distichum]|uniref:Uncharacterized protein n=1 Tax=Abeliophyllum distichum TaxID=126358 RepID=A0ABD1PTB5_9LAMI